MPFFGSPFSVAKRGHFVASWRSPFPQSSPF
uniref:Uncharacterized protein n=1 Tax=Arundo donax TaxID=35708 RepID=A0A0A9HUE3_ARUDO